MEVSSQWAKALEPNILKWVHEGFSTYPDGTAEVFRIINESAGIYRFHDSWGPKQIAKSTEGAATPELSRAKGYETTANPQIFKGKVSATIEWERWNKYPEIMQSSRDLGSAGIYSINLMGAGVWINGFSTSYTGYGDGLPLFSMAHTRPDGNSTNQSNASTAGITLTEANLETGINAMRGQLSGVGRLLAIGGAGLTVQVPFALEKEAVIITGSTKRSKTTDNDLNWYLGRVNVYVNPFISATITDLDGNTGSDTAWFLFEKSSHGVTFIWDQRPIYQSWQDENTNAMYTQIYFSGQTTWQHWYGLWGSKGDENSYSS